MGTAARYGHSGSSSEGVNGSTRSPEEDGDVRRGVCTAAAADAEPGSGVARVDDVSETRPPAGGVRPGSADSAEEEEALLGGVALAAAAIVATAVDDVDVGVVVAAALVSSEKSSR